MSDPHPEQIPAAVVPLKRFTFDVDSFLSSGTNKDLSLQRDALETRISNICQKVGEIEGHQIIGSILGLTKDADTLKKLAKGIDRIADILPMLEQISHRETTIETIRNDPEWFAGCFGDLSSEVDQMLQHIDGDIE